MHSRKLRRDICLRARIYGQRAPSFIETLVNIFPSNVIGPMSEANMLQVIVIALFFGFGVISVGEKGKPFADFVEERECNLHGDYGNNHQVQPNRCFLPDYACSGGKLPDILGNLLAVLLVAYAGYIIHMAVVYSFTVKTFGKISPSSFRRNVACDDYGFSSASSVGTLPLNLECVERWAEKKEVASFVLPLGATINMDGTAIYQGVCAIFIATCCINCTLGQQTTIILTATLASIGTAGSCREQE